MRYTQVLVAAALLSCVSVAVGKEPNTAAAKAAAIAAGSTTVGVPAGNSAARPNFPTNGFPPTACPNPIAGTVAVENPANVEQRASCLIQIDGLGTEYPQIGYEGGRGSRFDAQALSFLASTTALSEPAVQASLKRKAGLVGRQVFIAAMPTGNRFVRLEVSLKKGDTNWADGDADSVLAALTERLLAAAKESRNAENAALAEKLASAKEQLNESKSRLQEIEDTLAAVHDAMGGSGFQYGDPGHVVQNLRMQVEQMESEIDRQKARLATVTDEPLIGAEAEVKAAEKKLAKLTQEAKNGSVSAEAIAEAANALADAKEKVADARVQTAMNGNPRANNRFEARNIRQNIAEQESRLRPLKSRLAKLEVPGMAAKLARFQEQQQEEQRLRQEVMQLGERVRLIQRAMRDCSAVTLVVLDGKGK